MKKLTILVMLLFSVWALGSDANQEEIGDLEKSLQAIQSNLIQLKQKAQNSTGAISKDIQAQINNLEQDGKKISGQIQELKSSTGQAWIDIKTGISESLKSLNASYEKAKTRFDDKQKQMEKK